MNPAFSDFEWTVAQSYEWRDWLDKDGKPVVVPLEGTESLESSRAVELAWERSQDEAKTRGPLLHFEIDPAEGPRRYRPLQRQDSALFRQFAGLNYRDPEALLAFARQYGALGVPTRHQSVRVRDPQGVAHLHHAYGEPFLTWALEICYMREALRLLDRTKSLVASRRLKWLFDRQLQWVQPRLGFTPTREPVVIFEPLSLISAMWLQFGLGLTRDKQFVACKFCKKVLEISPEAYRSHRLFCSGRCKTLDYRKRKRTGLRLAAQGATASDIASKTNTPLKTARAWVASAKQANPKATSGVR
jgi:nucleotide-binding universal stress UspA family protein